jgi:hypothetical protein
MLDFVSLRLSPADFIARSRDERHAVLARLKAQGPSYAAPDSSTVAKLEKCLAHYIAARTARLHASPASVPSGSSVRP